MKPVTLIYTSKASDTLTESAIRKLAKQSSSNNAKKKITGLLLYGSGHFLQVLEGHDVSVRSLYEYIRHDPRHHDCELLYREKRPARMFPDWNMGLLNLDTLSEEDQDKWEDVVDLFVVRSDTMDHTKPDPLLKLIRQFVEHNRKGKPKSAT